MTKIQALIKEIFESRGWGFEAMAARVETRMETGKWPEKDKGDE